MAFDDQPVPDGLAKELTEPQINPPRADWGRCHSCNCQGFMSTPKKDNICGTCGHHWSRHWS